VKPSQTSKPAPRALSVKKEYRKPRLTTLGNVSKITNSTGSVPTADATFLR